MLEKYGKELEKIKSNKADLKITSWKIQQPKLRIEIRPFCPECSRGRQKVENREERVRYRQDILLVHISVFI